MRVWPFEKILFYLVIPRNEESGGDLRASPGIGARLTADSSFVGMTRDRFGLLKTYYFGAGGDVALQRLRIFFNAVERQTENGRYFGKMEIMDGVTVETRGKTARKTGNRITDFIFRPVSAAPLVTFRIVFGAMMVFGTVRFMALGWINDHYVRPLFHFKYYGFGWVGTLPESWLYAVHILMIASALGVMAGRFYRLSVVMLFLTFTYTELIDLTYYLNHYYFVSIVSFLMIFIAPPAPEGGAKNSPPLRGGAGGGVFPFGGGFVPAWTIGIFKLQLTIVYVYAGLAKINYDWLIGALPLKIWVPANDALPVVGWFFKLGFTPHLFSWFGMVYDCTIVFFLLWRKTRPLAYVTVIVFHLLTGLMFQIGVFPLVMIGATLIFFSDEWHEKAISEVGFWISELKEMLRIERPKTVSPGKPKPAPEFYAQKTPGRSPQSRLPILIFLSAFFLFQVIFPWRYVLYPGNLFWTEEGYRFSWRVMLMEKAGTATFYVKDRQTGREGEVVNSEFLNTHQEKQMAMQPDMILQYAHFLARHYAKQGMKAPAVRAEVYVTLNARPSRLLIDPDVDLTKIKDGWRHKTWILPDK